MKMQDQRYGIEIEMTGITRENAAKVVAAHYHTGNAYYEGGCYRTFIAKDTKGRTWKLERDSSISPEVKSGSENSKHYASEDYQTEMVSPILTYDDLEDLQQIVRELREKGAFSNNSCGIHVHVDGANHSPLSLKRLVCFMIARQDLIYDSLEIGQRANRWCHKLNENILKEMKKNAVLDRETVERIWYGRANDGYCGGINHEHYNETRYHGINLHAFFTKGTVEFRLFNGTLHAGKIKAYIQFCLAVSAWSINSQEHIVFRSMKNYTPAQKVTIMRNILTNRLGLTGNEFRTCRLHLMTPLKKAAGTVCRDAA